MAKMEVNGFEALMGDFMALASMPDSVANGILEAEADVVVEAQRKTLAGMWKGPYSTGDTARAVKKTKVRKNSGGKYITVYPQGRNRKGERNAAVAFINEYGKRGQPGRPAIRTANEAAADKAVEAGEKVYNSFLDSKKL